MRAAVVLGVVLLFSFAFAPFCAAADHNPWLVAPPLVKELSAEDQAARDKVVKIIAERRAKVSLVGWNLEVPMRASGVPAKYDILLHRGSGCFVKTDARLEIQVRDGQAMWELSDASGIYRVRRPAADIDRLVRQFAYAFHAVERAGQKKNFGISFSIGPAPHEIELISRDDKSPLHLQPERLQNESNSGGPPPKRLRNYAFAMIVEHVFPIAEREGKLISADEEKLEILRRLKAVPALEYFRPWTKDSNPFDRIKVETISGARRYQFSVERDVFGELAVNRSLAEAMPELKRLYLVNEQQQLEIAISADPKPLIQKAIADHVKDEQLATWAERFAADDKHPERLQWLIDVLPRLEGDKPQEYRADSICLELAKKDLNKEQLAQLGTQFNTTKYLKLKIGLANVLLTKTQEAKYFTYLDELVRTLPPEQNENSPSPRLAAAHHALKYAIQTGKQRTEARALLQKLLSESRKQNEPDSFEMYQLVEFLGDLGTPEDVPYLAGLAQSGSPYLMSYATKALARLDAKRALEILHARIERWNKQPVDDVAYSHEIFSNFELIVFERDVTAVPMLKKAWERLNAHAIAKSAKPAKPKIVDPDVIYFDDDVVDEPDRIAECYNPQHVIAFLEAKTGSARAEAAIAHFGDRAHYEERGRMERLVKQLIAEGADPKCCEVLLHVPEEPRWAR